MNPIDRLIAIEEIKQLKARYFRCVDTKDWAASQPCLRMMLALIDAVPAMFVTHGPAHGIWAMQDELRDRDQRLVLRGSGHYHETYVRLASGWAIKSSRMSRLAIERPPTRP